MALMISLVNFSEVTYSTFRPEASPTCPMACSRCVLQTNAAIEEQRVVDLPWIFCDRQRRGVRELVRLAHNEGAEGITRVEDAFRIEGQQPWLAILRKVLRLALALPNLVGHLLHLAL